MKSKKQEDVEITQVKSNEGEQVSGLQFFENRIQAGFPSPVQGEFAESIDLNRALITNPAATFCARVMGDSMVDAGINEGDLLIIDRSLKPHDGSVAVCFVDGEFTVKRLCVRDGKIFLTPANATYPVLCVSEDNNFMVWGIVSHIIKKV